MKVFKSSLNLILLLSFSIVMHSQDFKKAMMNDICDCLEQSENQQSNFQACYKKSLTNYAEMLDSRIVAENADQKFAKGQVARQKLLYDITADLVNICDYYFIAVESLRAQIVNRIKKGASVEQLQKAKEAVAQYPAASMYAARGVAYFGLEKYDMAEEDLNKSLELQPDNNLYAEKQLALLLEDKGNYNAALNLLAKMKRNDFDYENDLTQNIIRRKMNGSAPLLPEKNKLDLGIQINDPKKAKPVIQTNTRVDTVVNRRSAQKRANADSQKNSVTEKKKATTQELKKLFKIDNKSQ